MSKGEDTAREMEGDPFSNAIRAQLEQDFDGFEDDDATEVAAPLEEGPARERMTYGQAREAQERARQPQASVEDDDGPPAPKAGKAPEKEGETPEAAAAEPAGEQAQPEDGAQPGPDTDYAWAAEIPEAHREQVTALIERDKQFKTIEEAAAPYADTLKARGQTVADGVAALAGLNDFAMRAPGDYMAWFASQPGVIPEGKKADALIDLGKRLGVKLVVDEFDIDDDDDGEGQQPQRAPDPNVARQQHEARALLTRFESALGPDGSLAHPHFSASHPQSGAVRSAMHRRIMADVQAGKSDPRSLADLRGYYDAALSDVGIKPAPAAATNNATPGAKPASDDKTKRAARARRASAPLNPSGSQPSRRGKAPPQDVRAHLRESFADL